MRGAEGGGVTYPLLPQLDLHHGTVAVAQLEDVQVVLSVDVLLHGAVLSRHGDHAGNGTQLCKSTLWSVWRTWQDLSRRSRPPPWPCRDRHVRGQLSKRRGKKVEGPVQGLWLYIIGNLALLVIFIWGALRAFEVSKLSVSLFKISFPTIFMTSSAKIYSIFRACIGIRIFCFFFWSHRVNIVFKKFLTPVHCVRKKKVFFMD